MVGAPLIRTFLECISGFQFLSDFGYDVQGLQPNNSKPKDLLLQFVLGLPNFGLILLDYLSNVVLFLSEEVNIRSKMKFSFGWFWRREQMELQLLLPRCEKASSWDDMQLWSHTLCFVVLFQSILFWSFDKVLNCKNIDFWGWILNFIHLASIFTSCTIVENVNSWNSFTLNFVEAGGV